MPAIIALFEWVSSELSQNREQSYAGHLRREFSRALRRTGPSAMKGLARKAKILIIDLGMRLGYFAGRP